MRILIFGGSGFIGSHLVEFFSNLNGIQVTATYHKSLEPLYSRENLRWVNLDLRSPSQVLTELVKNHDVVIQAAATTSGVNDTFNLPDYHITDNVLMNSIILREVHRAQIRNFFFFSCTTMYQSSMRKQKEEDFNPSQIFYPAYQGVAAMKVFIENLCKFYAEKGSTKYSVIRHTNIYGPRDKFDLVRSHVFGASLTKVLSSETGQIQIWGDGKEVRDLLYIDDLVNLVFKMLNGQQTKFDLVNAGLDSGLSVADLVKRIASIAGKTVELNSENNKPTLQFSFISDSARASANYGWTASTSLDEGIKKTIAWWKNNIDPVTHTPYKRF